LLVAWLAMWLARCIEDRLEDKALTLVNALTTATDREELAVLIPQVERWLSRSQLHLGAYLRADAQLSELEQQYDARKLPPMTASEARECEPTPPDSRHNVEAREYIRALCVAELARLRQFS
jgi:ferric-dicitrate binding protein FerR (iron transport regulator)